MKFVNYPPTRTVGKFRWNHQALISHGIYSKTYIGKDSSQLDPNNLILVKIIEETQDEKQKVRVQNEINILKKIKSPNLIQLIDVFQQKNELILIMSNCAQGTLQDAILSQPTQCYEEKEALKILNGIVNGLKELASQKILHRDIRPENILGNNETWMISEFSVSKELQDFENEQLTTLCGTPLYNSPQILKGEKYNSKSLLMLINYILSGYLKFGSIILSIIMWEASLKSKGQIRFNQIN